MKFREHSLRVGITVALLLGTLCNVLPANADTVAPLPQTPVGLSISQLKITGDELVVITNNTGSKISASQLSQNWLYDYNNVSPLGAGVTSSTQQLPAVDLDAGQTLQLSSVTRGTCGAAIAGKLNISLTDSGGFLELVNLSQDANGVIQQTPGDIVSWSSAASGIIQKVPSSTADPAAIYYRTAKTTQNPNGWQLADIDTTNSCQLNAIITSGSTTTKPPVSSLGTSKAAIPATIISIASEDDDSSQAVASLPAADLGLNAPQITELLPNPDGTGNDDVNEFIELYNPNLADFDLSGFILQTGTTSTHKYVFPTGTILPYQSFLAFYSATTGLSLSNSGGQVQLLDPFGTSISASDTYGSAKDGQAWALANGKWYWTSVLTPNYTNVIKQAAAITKKKTSSKSKATTASAVKGASTTASSAGKSSSYAPAATTPIAPIHLTVLAVVAVLAVAYGVYEYRHDLANRIYQFRANRAARRSARA